MTNGQIRKHFHNTAVISKRRILQDGQVLHKTFVDNVFYDLVHEINLITV